MNQQACTFEQHATRTLNYLLFLPKGYRARSRKRWPLVLFLHGAGERGSNLERVKHHGIPKVIEQGRDLPCIAVSPQCPSESAWVEQIDVLSGLLDEISATHAVDRDRIYLTGLSMGGYGTWHLATESPQRFAAVVPVCGGGMWYAGFPERACRLKDVPLWVFHGALDRTVLLEESQELVDALEACGADVRFTVYPDVGHDSWTQTYDNPELYEWLFKQTRRKRRSHRA